MLSCTFAGHRNLFLPDADRKIETALDGLIARDETFVFYTGGMGEFDSKSIRRGENHIKILEAGDSYERGDGSIGTSWNVKHVFDVSQTTSKIKAAASVNVDDRQLLKALIHKSPVPIQGVDELPRGMGAYYDNEQKIIFVRRGMEAHDIFRSLSKELAHAELALSSPEYSRESAGFAAYSVSYSCYHLFVIFRYG